MTFDEWLHKEYGDKIGELGLVVPELMRGAWQASERDALERAAEMFDALGKELAASQVRALIEQDAQSGEKQK